MAAVKRQPLSSTSAGRRHGHSRRNSGSGTGSQHTSQSTGGDHPKALSHAAWAPAIARNHPCLDREKLPALLWLPLAALLLTPGRSLGLLQLHLCKLFG